MPIPPNFHCPAVSYTVSRWGYPQFSHGYPQRWWKVWCRGTMWRSHARQCRFLALLWMIGAVMWDHGGVKWDVSSANLCRRNLSALWITLLSLQDLDLLTLSVV
ncbi:MAG: hypothetical protein P1S60_04565 [Anaerolineae bacterium]|nr:hypothetical protein [Anaerolineae bacterium]